MVAGMLKAGVSCRATAGSAGRRVVVSGGLVVFLLVCVTNAERSLM